MVFNIILGKPLAAYPQNKFPDKTVPQHTFSIQFSDRFEESSPTLLFNVRLQLSYVKIVGEGFNGWMMFKDTYNISQSNHECKEPSENNKRKEKFSLTFSIPLQARFTSLSV